MDKVDFMCPKCLKRTLYFIKKDKVIWARMYDEREIEEVRESDCEDNLEYWKERNKKKDSVNGEKRPFWKSFFSKIIGK